MALAKCYNDLAKAQNLYFSHPRAKAQGNYILKNIFQKKYIKNWLENMEELLKYLGYVAGTLTTGSLIPQFIKTFRTKEAEDVSFTMYIIYLSSTVLWIIYGIIKEDWSIMGANAITCLLNVGMVSMKIKYDK